MIGFTLNHHDADTLGRLVNDFYQQQRIVIKYQPEKTALRVSLGAFNTTHEVDLLLAALRGTIFTMG